MTSGSNPQKGVKKYPRFLQDKGVGVKSEIAVQQDSSQMVTDISRALKSLKVSKKDKSKLEDTVEHMERVQRRVK
jgi:hypothetical protein